MAYREVEMWEILDVLRRVGRGETKAAIRRATGRTLVPDPETGRHRVLYALIVTLVYSRHQYVHVTTSQKLPDLIEGLEDAWEYFGGVASRVVLDNLTGYPGVGPRYHVEI